MKDLYTFINIYFQVLERQQLKFQVIAFECNPSYYHNGKHLTAKQIIYENKDFTNKEFKLKINEKTEKFIKNNCFWGVHREKTVGNTNFEISFIEDFYLELAKTNNIDLINDVYKNSTHYFSFYSLLVALKNHTNIILPIIESNINKINLFKYEDKNKNIDNISIINALKDAIPEQFDNIMIKYLKYNKTLINNSNFDSKNQYALSQILQRFTNKSNTKEFDNIDLFNEIKMHHASLEINKIALYRMIPIIKEDCQHILKEYNYILNHVYNIKTEYFNYLDKKEKIHISFYTSEYVDPNILKNIFKNSALLFHFNGIKKFNLNNFNLIKEKLGIYNTEEENKKIGAYFMFNAIKSSNFELFDFLIKEQNIDINFNKGILFSYTYSKDTEKYNMNIEKLLTHEKYKKEINFNLFDFETLSHLFQKETLFNILNKNNYFNLSINKFEEIFQYLVQYSVNKNIVDKILFESDISLNKSFLEKIKKTKKNDKEFICKIEKYTLNKSLESSLEKNVAQTKRNKI